MAGQLSNLWPKNANLHCLYLLMAPGIWAFLDERGIDRDALFVNFFEDSIIVKGGRSSPERNWKAT